MGGQGQVPKLPEDRVRRGAPQAGEWIVLPSGEFDGERPPCPMALSERAVEMWEDWWSSPMAFMWDRTDWPGLEILLLQSEELFSDPSNTSLSSEVRQKENIYGISPQGRQQRRWRLPEDNDPIDAGKERQVTTKASKARDANRKAILKSVK